MKSTPVKTLLLALSLAIVASAEGSINNQDWDIDGDGRADALTDGLLFLRHNFGLTGDPLINGVVADDAQYVSPQDLEDRLTQLGASSGDIDGNGTVDALTDGLLLLRYLFGLNGDPLVNGVIAEDATRTESSAVESYIFDLLPQAPYITLLGSTELAHEQATTYVDAGATATDYVDGTVAVTVTGTVDSAKAGDYTLTYSAVDSEGNEARPVSRVVMVADTVAPVITLAGEASLEIDQDSSYEDAGATAVDAVDGIVAVLVSGSVDTATEGTYTLTYTATDAAENSAVVTRQVTVKSTVVFSTASLIGDWTLAREAGALAVGPAADNLIWWSNNEIDVWRRACLFDDVYRFADEGTFFQDLGDETWLEPWQGEDPEACGAPVPPHDGSFTDGTYTVGDMSITLNGVGAHLGLAKVINQGDLSVDNAPEVPESITYTVTEFSDDGMSMTVQIDYGDGVWQFKLSKSDGTGPLLSDFGTGIDKVLNIGEVVDFNTPDVDYGLIDFGGTESAVVEDPTDSDNRVVSVLKAVDSEPWAGTTIATGSIFYPLTASKTGISLRVWSPESGVQVKLKLEQSGETIYSVETDATTTVAQAWETLTFDFSNPSAGTPALDATLVFDTLIIYFNYDVVGADETYYFDDIRFIGEVPVSVDASDLVGNWKLAPQAGALSVGSSADNLTTWSNSGGDVNTRSCLFDDLFMFTADGSFAQSMGSHTWVEVWQGATAEGCALPVAPHNSSTHNATYTLSGTDLVIQGAGAHLGLAKVTNEGELDAAENPPSIPSAITYSVTAFAADGNSMSVQIDYGSGVWQFKFVRTDDQPPKEIIDVSVAPNNNGSGNVYVIDGIQRNDLDLLVGTTYTFTHSQAHPLRFSETEDGIHNGGVEYTDGVDTSVSGEISIKVTSSTPSTLFYYCRVHPSMGGMISFTQGSADSSIFLEAENWSDVINLPEGDVATENTTDTGGGLNVGYIDAGDWLEYDLSVPSSGNYRIEYRVASQGGSEPGLNVKIDGDWVDAVEIPNTGGWQVWQTVEGRVVTIQAGTHNLRIEAASGSININWIQFVPTDAEADEPPAEVINEDPILAGDWTLAPVARALGVGPNSGDTSWWASSEGDITERACLFDDVFRFGAEGSFSNVMGDETWVETWQGIESQGCAMPVAPHDGSNDASFVFDSSSGTIVVQGVGAFLGIPKVVNAGEYTDNPPPAVPSSITYEIVASTTSSMTIQIGYGSGYWTFKLVKVASADRAVTETLLHDSKDRTYLTYVPNTYDGSEEFPVLLNFHGFGGQTEGYINQADMRHAAHTKKFLLVYPQGSPLDGEAHWNPSLPSADNKSSANDLDFIEVLIQQLASDYRVDSERIYAIGYSNGGMMSLGLGIHKSELIAAVGSVSGALLDRSPEPSRPVPVIMFHGTADSVIPYHGDAAYAAVESSLTFWIEHNNTETEPLLSISEESGPRIDHFLYPDGDQGSAVEHYRVDDGTHEWFDIRFAGLDTAVLIWNFFSRFDLNGPRQSP